MLVIFMLRNKHGKNIQCPRFFSIFDIAIKDNFELEEILEHTMDRFIFVFEMMNEKAVEATSNQLYSSYLAFNDNHLFQATFY